MTEIRVPADNGKFTFVLKPGNPYVEVLRHGEPWLVIEQGCNAVWSLVYEMNDTRALVAALRKWATSRTTPEAVGFSQWGPGAADHLELIQAFRAWCDETGEKKPPSPVLAKLSADVEAAEQPLRTVRDVKEWCLDSLAKLVAEFGAEDALKMVSEAWLGQAVDPDGRPLFQRRDEPVAGGATS